MAERVAEVLFTDSETVHERQRLYQAFGVTGIEWLNDEGGEQALNAEQLPALAAELDARLYMTANAMCGFVQRTFEAIYAAHAMAKLLKRPGPVYKPRRRVPAKANEDVQRTFVAAARRWHEALAQAPAPAPRR